MDTLHSRNYNKIFVGPRQDTGYENIFLSYEADTSEILLKSDTSTYFHIPLFSQSFPIQYSGLIEAGAVGGLTPYTSDKVFKKQADYEKYSPWGNTLGVQDGEWVCSWLYLSSLNATPVWMDRYYQPGQASYKEALTNTFTDRFNYIPNPIPIFDLPSKLTFDPGVWYYYFHVGKDTIQKTIGEISGPNEKYLTINLNSLSSVNENYYDSGTYKNQFNVDATKQFISKNKPYNSTALYSLDFTSDYINTFVAYNSGVSFTNNELGINFWLGHNDWAQSTNSVLVGNLQKNNFSVNLSNRNYYPYYVLVFTNQKLLTFFNQENNNYAFVQLNFTPSVILYDYDNNVIVAGERVVQKYDYTGAIIYQLTTSRTIADVAVFKDNRIAVLEPDKYTIYSSEFVSLSTTLGSYTNRSISIDSTDKVYIARTDPNLFIVDSNNNRYTARSNYIYINDKRTTMGTKKTIQKIAINQNELWVFSGNNTFSIYDIGNKRLLRTFNLVDPAKAPNSRQTLITFDFINRYNRVTKQVETSLIVLSNWENCLYELFLDGTIKRTTSLANLFEGSQINYNSNFLLQKSITGSVIKNQIYGTNNYLEFKVKAFDSNYVPHIFNLKTNINNFVKENWYLVTCNFKNNNLELYVNADLVGTLSIPSNLTAKISFKNNLYIGQSSGNVASINDEIRTKSIQYNGYLAGIKVYAKSLTLEDIILLVKENVKLTDIYWNFTVNKQQYIEEIEKFFKHRIPGSKSGMFNIKITGGNNYDPAIKEKIEIEIKNIINKTAPAYTNLYKIIWQ